MNRQCNEEPNFQNKSGIYSAIHLYTFQKRYFVNTLCVGLSYPYNMILNPKPFTQFNKNMERRRMSLGYNGHITFREYTDLNNHQTELTIRWIFYVMLMPAMLMSGMAYMNSDGWVVAGCHWLRRYNYVCVIRFCDDNPSSYR